MKTGEEKRNIVAMGGGGFSMEPDNLLLDQYVLGLTGKERPKICFIPTASGDSPYYALNFYSAFIKLNAIPTHLFLLNPTTSDPRSLLLEQDIVYVGGGNTKNMIALWREWGLDAILRECWEKGIVLCGISAGSICWFEQGVTDSIPGKLTPLPCLGFLSGSSCPHYDGEAQRRPSYQRMVSEGAVMPGYAADDGVALHYAGERLERIVSSRPQARAYRLEKSADGFEETPLPSHYLGSDVGPPDAARE
jgi:peptidase E